MAGVDITTIKELLGHKTLTMTLRYAHLAPSHEVKAVHIPDDSLTSAPADFTKKKGSQMSDIRNPLILLVGRTRFELVTNGLKVRCSTGLS